MRSYIIRRLLLMIPTLFMVSFITFFLVRLVPGDMIDAMNAQAIDDAPVDRAAVEKALGLDAPALIQYGRWLGIAPQVDGSFRGLFQGNLGESWTARRSVLSLVAKKWPVTLELGLIGLIIGQLIALPAGVLSALRQDQWGDYVARTIAILCISIPGFWLGTMVIVYPSIWWGYMPPIMLISINEDVLGNLKMFIVPAIILGLALTGTTMRMTRTMMLEVLRQDYIRTAWAKGLPERIVNIRHALRNGLIPVITILGNRIPVLIGGTVIIEEIFSLPGMGRLLVTALNTRDGAVMSGVIILYSAVLVLVNLIVDITYAFLDPRVRYK